MPYWSISCIFCFGEIIDALLECLPANQKSDPLYRLFFTMKPGAALACPYCNRPIGFDSSSKPAVAQTGWPVFRFGLTELELKKLADGEAAQTSLTDWALHHRFTQPGTHLPFSGYVYAEQAPVNETVP